MYRIYVKEVCMSTSIIWILLICHEVACSNDIWRNVTVSNALLNSFSTTRSSIMVFSDIFCAMAASTLYWSKLFCFRGGICDISSFAALPRKSPTVITDPVNCMTKLYGDGCAYNGVRYKAGDIVTVNAPDCLLVCQSDGTLQVYPTKNLSSPGSLCPGNFTQVGTYGCFLNYTSPSSLNFCALRKFCKDQGGDLITFEKNFNLAYFQSLMVALGHISMDLNPASQLHVCCDALAWLWKELNILFCWLVNNRALPAWIAVPLDSSPIDI